MVTPGSRDITWQLGVTMSVITKQIELTPQDVIEALRSFEEEEWAEVVAFLEA